MGSPSFTPEMRAEADVNGDGFVNHLDAELISSMIENNYATLSEAQLAGKQIADIASSNYSRDYEVTPTVSFQNAKLIEDLSSLAQSLEGHSGYPVGSLCIEDTSNNSYFLSYLGLTTFPIHPNYKTGDTALTTNDCFLYFSDGENYSIRTPAMGNKGYLIQESRHPETKDIQTSCEPGWIPFGNRCVMQYEASKVNGIATSQAGECPWGSRTSQVDAKAACEAIGAHLITNAEWMALARDIEQVDSNWTGGVVGSGVIKKGNTGVTVGGYMGDDYPYPECGVSNNLARLILSNGERIYHLSGNFPEWVDDEIDCGEVSECPATLMPYGSSPTTGYVEFANINTWGKYSKAELAPLEAELDLVDGVGKIYTTTHRALASLSPKTYSFTHAFLRGGSCSGDTAGVFSLYLGYSPLYSPEGVGAFRCVR